jgi:hypothetical protein
MRHVARDTLQVRAGARFPTLSALIFQISDAHAAEFALRASYDTKEVISSVIVFEAPFRRSSHSPAALVETGIFTQSPDVNEIDGIPDSRKGAKGGRDAEGGIQ